MAMTLGELNVLLKVDNTGLKVGLAIAKAETKAAGDDMDRSAASAAARVAWQWITGSSQTRTRLAADIDASKKKLRELSDEYGRTGDKSLLKDMSHERSQIKQFETSLESLSRGALREMAAGVRTAWSTMSSFASSVAGFASSLWGLAVVLLAISAAAIFAVPAIYILFGALGSLPALAGGLTAGIAVLGLGFMGLSERFQKTASSGQSVVDRAYQIAMAERHVRDANWEVVASQEALNRARMTAAQRMRDLTRNLAGARLDEESAIANVASAERDLERARLTENPDRIKAADLAYRQAQQSLADVKDRVTDLAAEQADAAKKGVEGSDVVVAALDRQRKAVEGVTDAQHALKEAEKPAPGGGGAAAQMTKLAPAALAFVAAIKSLKPAFESLRLDIQQKLFAGIGDEIKGLASAWLPTLHLRLGGMADMFNGLFKNLAASAKKPEFISNMSTGMLSVEKMIGRIGTALTGPFMDAWGRLSRAAAPFIKALGDGIAGIVEDFSKWIKKADESGELDKFFVRAGKFLTDVIDIGKDAFSIIGSILGILFSSGEKMHNAEIGTLKDKMHELAQWFDDPKNREKIAGFFKKIEDIFFWVKDTAIPAIGSWITKIDGFIKEVEKWGNRITGFKNEVTGAWDSIINFFSGLPGRISSATSGMWDGIKSAFKAAVNWIIGKWNNLSFTIGGGSFMGAPVPSATFNTPDIAYLAGGGVIDPTPGGRLAVLGEAGKREIATPEDLMRRIVREETGGRDQVPPDVHVYIGDQELRGMVRVELGEANRGLKRAVLAGAGAR